ncbi:pyridoxamine 5'-phosphate oxidase family protein [uncultured Desulfosarcina sp.]|uniref:pyridoxamine 5'-phosphate oxidase family protein n=1 Tax=uncultured Desulfosarcina sp. TaxID=218289 RepID=UPI0029C7FB59|nr:pyridoxamine 5'-phosphate oxidase family protein [uncultured Desulfosarcina sp.]
MNLKTYFEETRGMGVLSTADGEGRVNAAVYARPHVMEDGSMAFIMRDRLSHSNLQSNPHAAYLFREDGPGFKGVRLHLTKTHEESGTPLVKELCRRCRINDKPDAVRYLVVFKTVKELPLIGAGESPE